MHSPEQLKGTLQTKVQAKGRVMEFVDVIQTMGSVLQVKWG